MTSTQGHHINNACWFITTPKHIRLDNPSLTIVHSAFKRHKYITTCKKTATYYKLLGYIVKESTWDRHE